MADLVPWDPRNELRSMRDFFESYLTPGFFRPWWSGDGWRGWERLPSVDVRESDREVIVSAEIPGVDPEALELTLTEDTLTLRGEVKREEETADQHYRRIERRYGSFHRTIPLPAPVKHDQATAEYRNGVLEVRAPKVDGQQRRATRLRITSSSQPRH